MSQTTKRSTNSAADSLSKDKTKDKTKNKYEDSINNQKFQEMTESHHNEYKSQLIYQKAILEALYRLKEQEKFKCLQAMKVVKQYQLKMNNKN